MAKMWAGRFQKETDAVVNDFNSSVMFDCRMYAEDIRGSLAHAAMLGRQGIIAQEDVQQITDGLNGILADIEAGKIAFSPEKYEDIHMANEQLLTERIGDAGKRLHTARSRNDQVALDMRLYVKKEIGEIRALVLDFMRVLYVKASPMLDVTQVLRDVPAVSDVWVMSLRNECKELLFKVDFVHNAVADPMLHCVNITADDGSQREEMSLPYSAVRAAVPRYASVLADTSTSQMPQ